MPEHFYYIGYLSEEYNNFTRRHYRGGKYLPPPSEFLAEPHLPIKRQINKRKTSRSLSTQIPYAYREK